MSVSLLIIISIPKGKAIQYDFLLGAGYNYLPKNRNQQYTPHAWFGMLFGGESFHFGLVGFANQDRITRDWPGKGRYIQNRKQTGFGMITTLQLNEKDYFLSPYFMFSLGVYEASWNVQSDVPFLRENVIPRDPEISKLYAMLNFGVSAEIITNLHASLLVGYGQNNIMLAFRYSIQMERVKRVSR